MIDLDKLKTFAGVVPVHADIIVKMVSRIRELEEAIEAVFDPCCSDAEHAYHVRQAKNVLMKGIP